MKRKYGREEVAQCMSGRIYVNINDLNIFIRRKGGYSWTMNLGNKWSWVIIGAQLLLAAVILLIVL